MSDAERTRDVLAQDRQALWTGLRLSISQRFQYLLQLVPPSLTRPVAAELDAKLWQLFEATVGFSVPRTGGQSGLTLHIPEVPALHGHTYQECVVRLPVRLYGWGFRSLEDTCGPAYLGREGRQGAQLEDSPAVQLLGWCGADLQLQQPEKCLCHPGVAAHQPPADLKTRQTLAMNEFKCPKVCFDTRNRTSCLLRTWKRSCVPRVSVLQRRSPSLCSSRLTSTAPATSASLPPVTIFLVDAYRIYDK